MIISFRFKNSRSFFDETLMSMEAVSYREHPEHLVPLLNRKLFYSFIRMHNSTRLFCAFYTRISHLNSQPGEISGTKTKK